MSLWRLEWLRLVRSRRLVALAGVYVFFGFVGPLTARYLGEIVERFVLPPDVALPSTYLNDVRFDLRRGRFERSTK